MGHGALMAPPQPTTPICSEHIAGTFDGHHMSRIWWWIRIYRALIGNIRAAIRMYKWTIRAQSLAVDDHTMASIFGRPIMCVASVSCIQFMHWICGRLREIR